MFSTDALAAALEGRYTIERLVGEGGMAKVYLARDLRHNRQVALKVLRPDLGAVVGVDRFQSEIQVTANLQHPNLLPLFDSGAAGDLLYYVMPFVEGESLRARLDREKQLPVDEAVRLATAIAGALDYAHRKGVVHRDLKPENILIHEGQPLVADFGIALALSNAGGERITQTGLSLGTPQYMSPEQATGDRVIDARTDIYSLGALTYEMFVGEPPHVGATAQAIIARVLTETPRGIRVTRPSVPESVENAVARALEKIPADRFSSAKDFADALSGRTLTSPSSTALRGTTARASRRERALGVAALTFAVLALVAGVIAWRSRAATAPASPIRFSFDTPNRSSLQMAMAPDGHAIAYIGDRVSRPIVMRDLASLKLDTLRGTDNAFGPTWSPDSRELLFMSNGALKRINTVDHSVKVIANTDMPTGPGVFSAVWLPDGTIVFAGRDALYRIPVNGGSPTAIGPVSPASRWRVPMALPDGKHVLAVRTGVRFGLSPDSAGLYVISLDGSPPTRVSDSRSRSTFVAPNTLLSLRDHVLYAQRFNLRTNRLDGDPRVVVDSVGTNDANSQVGFAVSTNGMLALSSGDAGGFSRLAWYSRAGAKVSSFGDSVRMPGNEITLSPDDRAATMSVLIPPDRREVRLVDIARNVTTLLAESATKITWDRDSRSVRYPTRGTGQLRRLRLGAGKDSLFLDRAGDAPLLTHDVLSDGSVLATHLDTLVLVTAELPAKTRVIGVIQGIVQVRLSPDTKQIAYGSSQSGSSQVFVARYPEMDERRQVSGAGGGVEPRWRSDGRELFFLDLQGRVMSASLASGSATEFLAPTTLFQSPTARPSAALDQWAVTRDGQRFLFAESIPHDDWTSVSVVLNWPRLLKQ